MTIGAKIRTLATGLGVLGAILIVGECSIGGIVIHDAEARVGRPLTPGSVAGVSRRTTRRAIRRTTIFVATLPRGCTTVVVEGTTLSQCGGTYYQAYNGQYAVVNVD